MKVLQPYIDAAERMGGLPDGVELAVYDGHGDPPPLDDVEVYVPPYLFGAEVYELMGDMPALRICQTLTAGVDAVRPHVPPGVVLCNARGVHDASTAELVVALMLASLRDVPSFVRAQEFGEWRHEQRPSLADRTVLIVGYGSVGAAVERRLAGFEVEVLRVARSARTSPHGPVHGLDTLPALLPRADVVVLVVPMTDATRGLVDAAFLARMRDGALLVNAARGPVVHTDALLAELASGRLTAALDVTDPEPLPPEHPLWRTPGVLISPHVGGNTTAFLPRAFALLRDQLERIADGRPPANVVDGGY